MFAGTMGGSPVLERSSPFGAFGICALPLKTMCAAGSRPPPGEGALADRLPPRGLASPPLPEELWKSLVLVLPLALLNVVVAESPSVVDAVPASLSPRESSATPPRGRSPRFRESVRGAGASRRRDFRGSTDQLGGPGPPGSGGGRPPLLPRCRGGMLLALPRGGGCRPPVASCNSRSSLGSSSKPRCSRM